MMPALKKLYSQKGTLGVLEWIYDKKRFIGDKFLLKALFKIFPLESMLRITASYDSNIQKIGFYKSSKKYIQDLGVTVIEDAKSEIKGGCLIFGNHPTGLDPYIISSILGRDDIYIVADIYQKRKGENIGKQVIPIVYSRTQKNLANREFLNKIGFYVMRQFTGYVDRAVVKKNNEKTIQIAGKLIQDGHVVLIFPDGGSNNPEFWFNGIGEVIKTATSNQKPIQMYAANIKGISTYLLIRHFLFNRKKYLHDNPITIKLSQGITLEMLKLNKNLESKEITERLRSEFKTERLWVPNYAYNKKY